MKTTKISFLNSKRQKISGILEEPCKNKNQIVIIIHGYSSGKDLISTTIMSTELTERNINSLRIDLGGCGESEGNFKYQTITSTVDDTEAAIKYVKSLGYKKIDLFGSSAGGLTVMATALKHPEINRLGLKCPVSDYLNQKIQRMGKEKIAEWQKTGTTLYTDAHGGKKEIDYSVFEDYKNYIMFDKVNSIKCPTLIIHGDADEIVDIEDSKKIVKNFPQANLIIIPGADHWFTNLKDREKTNIMFGEWFQTGKII